MPIPKKFLNRFLLMVIVVTFSLLLLKNPFSERNLIPNVEPFPDTIHYLSPPLSFVEGKGFVIEREGRTIKPAVPFLYSASLTPGFFLYRDARIFYFTNIILAFLALIFFYKFLNKLIPNTYINLLVIFLYVTNYFIFWYPNLPMAENLVLTLYTIGLYLLVSELTLKRAFLSALVGISFYATKYANLSLTLTFLFLFALKICLNFKKSEIILLKENPKKLIIPLMFFVGAIVGFVIFFILDNLIRGNNIFLQLLDHLTPMVATQMGAKDVSISSSWFSLSYFNEHIRTYLYAVTGDPMRFLWDYTPLVPKYIALPALLIIMLGLLKKGNRFISFSLVLLILLPIIAIAPFYTTDARYIYHVIPTILTGFGLFLMFVYSFFSKEKKKFFYLFLILLLVFYASANFYRLKYQAVLNLKYAETPWHYLSVKTFNEFFENHKNDPVKPILITALNPYYIDFFSNQKYSLLPLSKEQEFFRRAESVWGQNDYSDLVGLYQKYLNEGKALYITNAALGNEGYLHNGFNLIKANFTVEEVNKGCHDTCNIYRVTLKK